jgi:hypothetical protein
MPSRHGSRDRYHQGCKCTDCKAAEAAYRRRYRERKLLGDIAPAAELSGQGGSAPDSPGPIESVAVEAIGPELARLRPDLTAVAVSLAQLMDDPRAKSQRAACAGTAGPDARYADGRRHSTRQTGEPAPCRSDFSCRRSVSPTIEPIGERILDEFEFTQLRVETEDPRHKPAAGVVSDQVA